MRNANGTPPRAMLALPGIVPQPPVWQANRSPRGGSFMPRYVSSSTRSGYFDNFRKTHCCGIETRFAWARGANYNFLDATYRSSETFLGEANSDTYNGALGVNPGDRIPLIPRQLFKLSARYALSERLNVGADAAPSATYAATGTTQRRYQGSGKMGATACSTSPPTTGSTRSGGCSPAPITASTANTPPPACSAPTPSTRSVPCASTDNRSTAGAAPA